MANICFNYIEIDSSNKVELEKMFNDIADKVFDQKPDELIIKYGYHSILNVLVKYGYVKWDPEKNDFTDSDMRIRGSITEFYFDGGIIHICVETAWSPNNKIWYALARKYLEDDFTITWTAEECGMNLYLTNDKDKAGKYYFEISDTENEDITKALQNAFDDETYSGLLDKDDIIDSLQTLLKSESTDINDLLKLLRASDYSSYVVIGCYDYDDTYEQYNEQLRMEEEKMKRGKLIVIEGIDGSGKTTQIELLKKTIDELGLSDKFYFTKEPTDSPIGKELRKMLSAPEGTYRNSELATTFLADRVYHNVNPDGIQRYLENGINVICDRYYYSNLVYQGFGEYHKWVKDMNVNCPDIAQPDMLIYIDVEPEEACRRISESREGSEVFENIDTLTKVRESYFDVISEFDPCGIRTDFMFSIVPKDYDIDQCHNLILYILTECMKILPKN